MKTSATDASGTLVLFADAEGALGRWTLTGAAASSGEAASGLPGGWSRTALAVPGQQVAIHWIELEEGLTDAQAAAAARLKLADASAAPLAGMHVAVGRPERGLTPVAFVPAELMGQWLAAAAAVGADPELVLPSPLLLLPPQEGFVRRDSGEVGDYRGPAAAFAVEPELAAALVDGAAVENVDAQAFAAMLAEALAAPALNLRQGAFARRRQWRVERSRLRRVGLLALALALLSLAVQVAVILSYTFAADRMQAEADSLAAAAPGGEGARPSFAATASVLFDAVRATPNAELSRLDYRPDGSLVATVMMDGPATLAALQSRIGASGLSVEPTEQRTAGGRPAADLIVRPG